MTASRIRAGLIGCGEITAGFHLPNLLLDQQTEIVALCDPYLPSIEQVAKVFRAANRAIPPNESDLDKFLKEFDLDVVLIATPHAMHHDQTVAAMEAGLDVLLEKPMVVNTREALSLIDARDRTGRTLVVAFPGSLSPLIRLASDSIRKGLYGDLLSVSATVWQNWGSNTAGTWRQNFALSGGGFLFDTGAHMLNTVADLVNQDFVEVAAWMDTLGRPVETLSVVIARLASGALVSLHGCGESIPACDSDVKIFCKEALLTTGVWGHSLSIQKSDELVPHEVPFPQEATVWETFLRVRSGQMENPSPPEVGLRMIRLYDAIRLSAQNGGQIVKIGQ